MLKKCAVALLATLVSTTVFAQAKSDQQKVREALKSNTGCFLVDYSYTETEALKPGYTKDNRVYDVNGDKSVKEWVYAEDLSPTKVRLQHILFAADLDGKFMDGSMLKHTGEDWEYQAPFLYDFTKPNNWEVVSLAGRTNEWTRKITNLDDGLRYQCSAPWTLGAGYPEWTCSSYAPIPGRETRDMKRKDYQALDRETRIIAYGSNWLERQANTKIIDDGVTRTPLAKEVGKNWYVRIADSECNEAKAFVQERKDFWSIVNQAWEETLIGDRAFVEIVPGPGVASRYWQMADLEEDAVTTMNLKDPATRTSLKNQILKLIRDFRAN